MPDALTHYVVPLGVSAALPDQDQANTFLAVVRHGRYWLVDCADSPINQLRRANLDPLRVDGVIITHFHPDHVYGLPAYLLGLFMLQAEGGTGLGRSLPIYARGEVLALVERMLALFSGQGWLDALPLELHAVEERVGARVCSDTRFIVTAAPAQHSIPSLAVRFALPGTGSAFVYSGDTAPCEAVERLALGAQLLLHEATDTENGHTRPEAAGALAARAGVQRLGLIHLHAEPARISSVLARAETTFGRPVFAARAFEPYTW